MSIFAPFSQYQKVPDELQATRENNKRLKIDLWVFQKMTFLNWEFIVFLYPVLFTLQLFWIVILHQCLSLHAGTDETSVCVGKPHKIHCMNLLVCRFPLLYLFASLYECKYVPSHTVDR